MTYYLLRKAWLIRPVVGLIIVAMVMSGCMAGRLTPPQTTVKTLHTIAILPVEAPPVLVYDVYTADRDALSKSGFKSESSRGGDPLGALALLVLVPVIIAAHEMSHNGEDVSIKEQQPPLWMPTIGLGKKVVELLQRPGLREAFLVEGYARLSSKGIDDAPYPDVVRHYYNSDVSTVDHWQGGVPQADAIVEIGVYNCSYMYQTLFLHVMVKLIDPTSRRVLGRTRRVGYEKGGAVGIMLQNEGQPLKRLIETTGERLLVQCLQDLGLYGP